MNVDFAILKEKRFCVEKEWEINGYKCVVVMTQLGHRCGYVGIPASHPLYGYTYGEKVPFLEKFKENLENCEVDMDKKGIFNILCYDGTITPSIFLNVHGGITYSNNDKNYPIANSNLWWYGFDCAHAGDAKDLEVLYIINQAIYEIENKFKDEDDKLRTLEYCENECNSLANQLKALEDETK
jgi:hypothetical protein